MALVEGPAVRVTDFMEYPADGSDHSGLMPADFTTLAHFSVSAEI
jgi:hypothetical protein